MESSQRASLGWEIGPNANAQRVGRWLFVSFALLYTLTMHGGAFSDSQFHFEQIATFMETGQFVMWPSSDPEQLPQRLENWTAEGVDGNWYSLLPPGLALTATPLGWLGARLGLPTPGRAARGVSDRAMMFWASLLMPLAIAAMLTAIYQLAYTSSGSVLRGLQAALVIGLATNTWFYATTFWTRPLAAACLVGALATVLQAEDRATRWAIAGGLLGWALVIRPDMVFILPCFLGLALYRAKHRWRAAVSLMLPILLSVIALMLWNEHRFGDLLSSGSPHQTTHHYKLQFIRRGLPRLLFGEKDGLYRFVPVLLLGLAAIPAAYRRHRDVVIFCLVGSATLIIFYATYLWGKSVTPIAWGSRHLYPVVPLLLIPAFLSRDYDPLSRWWAKALVALSIPLQFYGVWQRSLLGSPIWWLADPVHWFAAGSLAATLVVCIWRLLRALEFQSARPPPDNPRQPIAP